MTDWRTRIQQLDGEVIGNCGHHHSGCYPDVGLRSYHDNLALEGGSFDWKLHLHLRPLHYLDLSAITISA